MARLLNRFALAVSLAGCSAASFAPNALLTHSSLRAHSTQLTGVVLPMYMYPGKIWDTAIAAKAVHPNVPMIFIANVNNGPGTKLDPTYASFVSKAQRAGIVVIGYVHTSYGKRSATIIDAEMARWKALYNADGIFLDEMAPHDPSYYQAATAYAHAHSLPLVMGNPGVDAPGNSGPDIVNYFEQHGYPTISFLKKSTHVSYGKERWSYMAGAVPLDTSRIAASTAYVGYLYATDGKEPECYCKLPTYFAQLVAALDVSP